jgi:hypothetical protein
MADDKKDKVVEAIKESGEKLQNIGIGGANSITSRLTSVGVVGVMVILFCFGCYAFWGLLKDQMSANHDAVKGFMVDLQTERNRQDARWLESRDRSDAKFSEIVGAVKDTQRSIQDGQKTMEKAVVLMEQAVKSTMKE